MFTSYSAPVLHTGFLVVENCKRYTHQVEYEPQVPLSIVASSLHPGFRTARFLALGGGFLAGEGKYAVGFYRILHLLSGTRVALMVGVD